MANQPIVSGFASKALAVSLLLSACGAQADAAWENTNALANGGDSKAQLKLADAYYSGKNGVERSCEQAIYWFERAAKNQLDMGIDIASYNLGQVYADNTCPEYSVEQSAYWYEVAANRGVPAAQTAIGLAYLQGVGVDKNSKSALGWFQMAAKQENAAAQIQLAQMYLTGTGVTKSIEEAYFWMEKAARRGDVEGQARLAQWYATDRNKMQDNILAYTWASIAATKTGDTQFVGELEKRLNKSDLKLAKRLIASCIKTDYRECDYAR